MAAGDKAALAKAEDRFLEAALAQLQAELEPFARETTEDISMVLREAGLLQARHRKVRSTQFEGEPVSAALPPAPLCMPACTVSLCCLAQGTAMLLVWVAVVRIGSERGGLD